MSAYGAIRTSNRPTEPLATTIWYRPARKADLAQPSPSINYVTIHHLTLKAALEYSDLVPYLHASFAEELERGMTYPQEILQGETYTQLAFEGYFFAADVLVAIIGHDNAFAEGKQDGNEVRTTLDEARNGRSWEECIAGFYYVSPSACVQVPSSRVSILIRVYYALGQAKLPRPLITRMSPLILHSLSIVGVHRYYSFSGFQDLQCWVLDTERTTFSGLWSRTCTFLPSLWPSFRVRSQRVQPCICEQRSQCQVRTSLVPRTSCLHLDDPFGVADYGRP